MVNHASVTALVLRRALLLPVCVALLACTSREPEAAAPATLRGQVRKADQWIKVAPLVLHDGRMDLATRCLLLRDDAKAKGQDVPVCFDKAPRVVTTIAVERDKSMPMALQRLTAKSEAAHFVVDHNGAIYQLLDLAFTPRHGDAYRPGEVRVIACQRASEDALVAALRGLYPTAKIEIDETPPQGVSP